MGEREVTDTDILRLYKLAMKIGDMYLADLCRKALYGDEAYRLLVSAVINAIRH